MLDITQISNLLIKGLVVVIFGGYIILGLMVSRQVGILCKILGTNLAPMLRLASLLHVLMIVIVTLIVLALV